MQLFNTFKIGAKHSLILIFIFSFCRVLAQTPRPVPSAYTNPTVNYVRTWEMVKPVQDGASITLDATLQEARMTTQYLDGLGRPLQTVVKGGSMVTGSSAVDMVTAVEYDAFGREQFKYLPFAANSNGGNAHINDGLFKTNPFQQQAQFSAAQYPGETFYYAQTQFEPSPLNRVTKQMAAGNSWTGGGRGIETKYWINTATDAVRIWTVTDVANNFGTYASTATYAAGALYKNVTVDEHNKQVIEFKDKEGQVILKKVQLTAAAETTGTGANHVGWLCTYYIYDDLNRLRAVIQPKAVQLLDPAITTGAAWALDATMLSELVFRYEYDGRGRMILKKVPGAGEVRMVYDNRDRLVLTQDANQRPANQWLFTKYDALNRPVMTGFYVNGTHTTQAAMQAHLLSQNMGFAETVSGTAFPFYTLNQSFPVVAAADVLTATYYDNHQWTANLPAHMRSFESGYSSYMLSASSTYPYIQAHTPSSQTTGLVTGSITRVPGVTLLAQTNFYDEKGRVIQTKTENITGGYEIANTQYDFSGKVQRTFLRHNKAGTNDHIFYVVGKPSYDELGRVTTVRKDLYGTINGQNFNVVDKIVAQNEYDALGQLKKKKLGTKPTASTELAKLEYEYNIRGWLLSVNKGYMNATNSDQYFAMELGYDKNPSLGTFSPQYNGNISGALWKSEGDQQRRRFNYSYDNVNRLTAAAFTQYVSGSGSSALFNTSAGLDFSVSNLTYDANGNILSQSQKGWKGTTSVFIDQLTYNYTLKTNKLLNVIDAGNDAATKLGDFRTSTLHPNSGAKTTTSIDYTYDANGNMVKDLNKDIVTFGGGNGIEYNHLNLPKKIYVKKSGTANKGTIEYEYDAAGNKLKKITTELGAVVAYNGTNYTTDITTTTTYVAGFVYETKGYSNATLNTSPLAYTDKIQFLSHEEGRARVKPAGTSFSFEWDYFIKDHLGNVRMVLTEEQQQDQYPAATLEGSTTAGALSMVNYEKKFYTINNTYITPKGSMPGWTSGKDYQNNNGNPPPNASYPSNYTVNSTAISQNVYKLNATTNKTGLGIVLKVMAGDKIDIHGKSYYQSTTTYNNTNSTLLTVADIIGAFIGAPDNAGVAGKGITSAGMQTLNTGLIPSTFIRGNNGESTTVPKAYINYLFFDEQFKYAGGSFSRVGTSGTVKNHWFSDAQLQNIAVPKNGYIYVYVSNESNANVFFDNLQVFHTKGAILEETHYYPFGLTMAGISSKAAGGIQNRLKYNGGNELQSEEFGDGFGLELYDAVNRLYDPQLGRFWQVDELAESSLTWTPYMYGYNNPILFNDPLGLDPEKSTPDKPKELENVTVVSVKGGLWGKTRFYYSIMDRTGGNLDRIVNNKLREMMYRIDGIVKHREKVNEMTHESDLYIYGTLFSPLAALFSIEVGLPLLYQGGQVFLQVGGRLINVGRLLNDQLRTGLIQLYKYSNKQYNKAIQSFFKQIIKNYNVRNLKDYQTLSKILDQANKYRDLSKDFKVVKEIYKLLDEISKLK